MKKISVAAGLALLLLAGQAAAQAYRSELSTFGSYTRIKQGGQTTSFSILDVGYGYYFTPQFVGTLAMTRVSADGFGYTDLGIGAKYYFGIGRRGSILPFIDANFGIEKTPSYHDSRWQAGGGFAWFVTEATSFDLGMHYYRVSTEPSRTSGTIMGMGFTTRF